MRLQDDSVPVQDIDLEDGTRAVPTVDTQLSGILRGQGCPLGASHVSYLTCNCYKQQCSYPSM